MVDQKRAETAFEESVDYIDAVSLNDSLDSSPPEGQRLRRGSRWDASVQPITGLLGHTTRKAAAIEKSKCWPVELFNVDLMWIVHGSDFLEIQKLQPCLNGRSTYSHSILLNWKWGFNLPLSDFCSRMTQHLWYINVYYEYLYWYDIELWKPLKCDN